jgi:hypothetical protein
MEKVETEAYKLAFHAHKDFLNNTKAAGGQQKIDFVA